jgi:hypothetical protein
MKKRSRPTVAVLPEKERVWKENGGSAAVNLMNNLPPLPISPSISLTLDEHEEKKEEERDKEGF